MTTEIAFASAVELAALIRAGRLGAAECLEGYRARVERLNPSLRALVGFDWQRAFLKAAEADRAASRRAWWGPLHGVPVTVKESFDVRGMATTWGFPERVDALAADDDHVVKALERAGAVVFGKSNVATGLHDFQTSNAVFGTTVNPWDASRTAGGSSGGSAAAVAAGLTALDVGSDLGGSIRQPAHCCGVFGHKPSFGRWDATRCFRPGASVATEMAVAGPLARSAEDLALVMDVLTRGELARAPRRPLRTLRVAVWWAARDVDVDTEILDGCEALVDALGRAGVTVSDRARPDLDEGLSQVVFGALVHAAVQQRAPTTETRALQKEVMARWSAFFREWDLVVTPVSPVVAFAHDHRPIQERSIRVNGAVVPYSDALLFWPGLASVAHLPATAFPVVRGASGMPRGVQVIGPAGMDALTIQFAHEVTREWGGFVPPLNLC